MKKSMVFGLTAVLGLFLGSFCAAAEGNGTPKAYEVEMNRPTAVKSVSMASSTADKTKCFLTGGYRYYYYGYYYPRIYYYPVCYTYTYGYTYYCYSYVTFYKGLKSTEEIGVRGLRMEKSPENGTPLAKLGVKKGDIITEIDGKPVKSEKDMSKVTENSKLTVLKDSSETAASAGTSEPARSRSGKTLSEWFAKSR